MDKNTPRKCDMRLVVIWKSVFPPPKYIPLNLYLPTLAHYAWVSRLQTKDINLTHQGQFLFLTHKSGRAVLKRLHFISDLLLLLFFALYNNCKAFMSTIRSNRIQGNIRKSSENRRKSSEVSRTFRKSRS